METACNNERKQKRGFAYRGRKKNIDFILDLKCSVSLILNHVHLRTFIPIIVTLCWKSPSVQPKPWICRSDVIYGGSASNLMLPDWEGLCPKISIYSPDEHRRESEITQTSSCSLGCRKRDLPKTLGRGWRGRRKALGSALGWSSWF